MKKIFLIALSLMATPAMADDVYYFPAPIVNSNTPAHVYNLPMGTRVTLMTNTQINTKYNSPGDRLRLEVAENVVDSLGNIVVPAGSPAYAEVTTVQRNGHVGKKGKIEIRLTHMVTPHGVVRLMGRSYDEGKSGTAVSVGTFLFVSTLGYFIHGTSADIPAGTLVNASTLNDLRYVSYKQTAPAPATYSGPTFNF